MATRQISDFPSAPQALADADIIAAEQEVSSVWTTCKITLLQLYTYVVAKITALVSAGQVVYNNGGSLDGAAKTEIDENGNLRLVVDTSPATPAADKIALPAIKLGGRPMLAALVSEGAERALGASWGHAHIGMWSAAGNTALVPAVFGLPACISLGGTGSLDVIAGGTVLQSLRKSYNVSSGSSGTSCGWRSNALQFYRSTAAHGGFFMAFRFGEWTTPANGRAFAGVYGTAGALGNANPSTALNIIGMGYDTGETEWSIMHNDGSGTATKVSLGANFPCNVNTEAYDLYIWAPAGQESVWVEVVRLGTAHRTTVEITTDLPALDTLLAPQVWGNNGTTASAKGMAIAHLYTEVDL